MYRVACDSNDSLNDLDCPCLLLVYWNELFFLPLSCSGFTLYLWSYSCSFLARPIRKVKVHNLSTQLKSFNNCHWCTVDLLDSEWIELTTSFDLYCLSFAPFSASFLSVSAPSSSSSPSSCCRFSPFPFWTCSWRVCPRKKRLGKCHSLLAVMYSLRPLPSWHGSIVAIVCLATLCMVHLALSCRHLSEFASIVHVFTKLARVDERWAGELIVCVIWCSEGKLWQLTKTPFLISPV